MCGPSVEHEEGCACSWLTGPEDGSSAIILLACNTLTADQSDATAQISSCQEMVVVAGISPATPTISI